MQLENPPTYFLIFFSIFPCSSLLNFRFNSAILTLNTFSLLGWFFLLFFYLGFEACQFPDIIYQYPSLFFAKAYSQKHVSFRNLCRLLIAQYISPSVLTFCHCKSVKSLGIGLDDACLGASPFPASPWQDIAHLPLCLKISPLPAATEPFVHLTPPDS